MKLKLHALLSLAGGMLAIQASAIGQTVNTGDLFVSSGTTMYSAQAFTNTGASAIFENQGSSIFASDFTNTSSATTSGNGYYDLSGNWMNNATFQEGISIVNFTGGTTTVDNGTTNNEFYDVFIAKQDDSLRVINNDLIVMNSLVFNANTPMLVSTSGGTKVDVRNTSLSAIFNYSNIHFIAGKLKRALTTTTDSFAFPVGLNQAGGYRLISLEDIDNLGGVSGVTISFQTPPSTFTIAKRLNGEGPYDAVHPGGQWNITPNTTPSSALVYDLHAFKDTGFSTTERLFSTYDNSMDNKFALVTLVSGAWTKDGNLTALSTLGRREMDRIAIRNDKNLFAPVAFGYSNDTVLPLPVKFTSFEAQAQANAHGLLTWGTSMEENNAGFDIERSIDGISFEKVAFVSTKAQGGNSNNRLTYNYTDANVYAAWRQGASLFYYRLRQVDNNGDYKYSDIRIVRFIPAGASVAKSSNLNIFPNPANTYCQVRNASTDNTILQLQVLDMSRRVVSTQEFTGGSTINTSAIAAGRYQIVFRNQDGTLVQTLPLIVAH